MSIDGLNDSVYSDTNGFFIAKILKEHWFTRKKLIFIIFSGNKLLKFKKRVLNIFKSKESYDWKSNRNFFVFVSFSVI